MFKFSCSILLSFIVLLLMLGCTASDIEMGSLGKKLPAPEMKGSVFDQDVGLLRYVHFTGSCDSRVQNISVSFKISSNPNSTDSFVNVDKAAQFLIPPVAPDITGTSLVNTTVNDVDCTDKSFDFYLTTTDIQAKWGFDLSQKNLIVFEVNVKGATIIGDTQILIMTNPNAAPKFSLSMPMITFVGPFGNSGTTPSVLFIPSTSGATSVDHYEMRILKASDRGLIKDWTLVKSSVDPLSNILILDGLSLLDGEVYTPEIRAVDTDGLVSPSVSTVLTWKVLTKIAVGFGSNTNGRLGLGSNDPRSSIISKPHLVTGGRVFTQVDLGNSNTCGIEEGTQKVYCWGSNWIGQLGNNSKIESYFPVAVAGVNGGSALSFMQIEVGGSYACGLEAKTGHAYCWGANWNGQLGNDSTVESHTPVAVLGVGGGTAIKFSQIATGNTHTCGIEAATGKVYCWGYNVNGQLGNGSTIEIHTPVAALGVGAGPAISFAQIAVGNSYTCGIESTSGNTYCWGGNWNGQLGNDSTVESHTPVAVLGGGGGAAIKFSQIAAGISHVCGIESTTGNAYCWGYNGNGQLGNNSTLESHIPVAVSGVGGGTAKSFTQITVGVSSVCGVEFSTSYTYCWGDNWSGQLGNNSRTESHSPVAVVGVDGSGSISLMQVKMGSSYACGLEVISKKTYCWGGNWSGELGINAVAQSIVPAAIAGLNGGVPLSFTELSNGSSYACGIEAVTQKGYCWGGNWDGQLGNDSTVESYNPVAVFGVSGGSALQLSQIAAGFSHTCGIEAITGRAYCWGVNWSGQLGNNSTTLSKTPVAVVGVSAGPAISFKQIAMGGSHTCGIEAITGNAYCWGYNGSGQLGNNSIIESHTPVAVSGVGGGPALQFSQIAAGYSFTCGVEVSTGNAYCWGGNGNGQLGNNSTIESHTPVVVSGVGGGAAQNFTHIALGFAHTCGIEATTKNAYCWGYNGNGQLGNNSTIDSSTPVIVLGVGGGSSIVFAQITAGNSHTCGIEATTAKAYCWGSNLNGQLGDSSKEQRLTPVPILSAGTTTASSMRFLDINAGGESTIGIIY